MSLAQPSDPSSSNFLDSPELPTQPSRKRQRSLSMQSDSGASSSSVKRSVADNSSNDIQIRSPRTDQLSTLSLADSNNQDIDAYMAEQGEANIPIHIAPLPHTSDAVELSLPEDKVSLVNNGKSRMMEVGQTWYLISRTWYKRWLKACTGEIDKEGPLTERDLGPVDNTSILDDYNNLLPSLIEGVDVEYVPEDVWNLFLAWYGPASQPLPRRVIARGRLNEPALELRPLILKVYRLVASPGTTHLPHHLLTISAGETISHLCSELASKVSSNGEVHRPYRVWQGGVRGEQTEVDITPSQLLTSDAKIVEESEKTLEEEGIESDDVFIVEFKSADGWVVEVPKFAEKFSAIETPRPLFNSSEGFFNKMSNTLSPATSTTATTAYKPATFDSLGGVFEDELNRDNPLGMGGAIAESFGALLQRIWATTGTSTSYSPRDFKTQLQRFAPQFSGYQQHDSQELVAFLLDGLHEDLNRVIKKPYVEKPDWEGGGDVELVKLAQKSWEGYMMRNDSVILITLETFSHRFYKNLDDHVLVGDMSDSDTIVCFELPCNSRQSKSYKPLPDDPFIIPVFLCDAKTPGRSSYFANSRGTAPTLFGYPMVVAIDREQAKDVDSLYDIIATRLERWTAHARDLYTWEAVDDSHITQVPIQINGVPPVDALTEIAEDGTVVTIQTGLLTESDIVDEKKMAIDDDGVPSEQLDEIEPRKVGVKKDIFTLRLQVNHKDYGTAYNAYTSNNRWESWESRATDSHPHSVLLQEDDALYCEFEEDKKAYYFGDSARFEHALWEQWTTFTHPEYEESKKAGVEKRSKGISLRDCLDEFTKEEQLGEDDLWYCPQCKKHQQATKKFDLWKVPDILVVHLKRFSNNRSLRDKIDAHIDFPVEGLDLGDMVGERGIGKKLMSEGIDIKDLGIGDITEPLIYDLFGVDEHMGGLGGGHYRAYASNHLTGKWYHFDDSYVTTARPSDAVNPNAYLLFYRRRTKSPIGGKSFTKIQEAKSRPESGMNDNQVHVSTQLPTPPLEGNGGSTSFFSEFSSTDLMLRNTDQWNLRSNESNGGSSVPSPPTDDPPDFDDYQIESMSYNNDPLVVSTSRYEFPDPNNKASPTSSNEADVDVDTDLDQDDQDWDPSIEKLDSDADADWDDNVQTFTENSKTVTSDDGTLRWESSSNKPPPSYLDHSGINASVLRNNDNTLQIDSHDNEPKI
uniref:ubiquitinyl hydrolase 1 n=1 Tax=Psilocybe cubensis TaxID=181762 RepID=A0A8H8CI78_PSICU